jgi:hypothetical protein
LVKSYNLEAVRWLTEALDAFAETLPTSVSVKRRQTKEGVEYSFQPVEGPSLSVDVYPDNIEVYFLLFQSEFLDPKPEDAYEILKFCETVRGGRVWEISSPSRKVRRIIVRIKDQQPKDWWRDQDAAWFTCLQKRTYDWVRTRYRPWPENKENTQ